MNAEQMQLLGEIHGLADSIRERCGRYVAVQVSYHQARHDLGFDEGRDWLRVDIGEGIGVDMEITTTYSTPHAHEWRKIRDNMTDYACAHRGEVVA